MKKPTLLYVNIPWMKRYEGASDQDIPQGKFKFTREHPLDDHCQFNFMSVGEKVYGHVPGSTNPNLTNLGGTPADTSVGNVTVVWIATDPDSNGRVIVGWYQNARVWKIRQNPTGAVAQRRTMTGDSCQFSVEASADHAECLLPGKRPSLNTSEGRPGQSPFWYGNQAADDQVLRLIADNKLVRKSQEKRSAGNARGGWIIDPVERLKIETNAMECVHRYYTENGYDVEDKSAKNCGYDLLAKSAAAELHLEVKGNKGKTVCIELTPNEFSFAKDNPVTFRLCVVLDALNNRNLRIFRFVANANAWQDESGACINTIEKTGAVIRETA